MRAEVTLPGGFCLFSSGYIREYSSQWAHFLGEKITYIHFREKETKLQSQVTTVLRGFLLFVSLPVVHLHRRILGETCSSFNCGKSLSLAAYKLSVLHTYLMSFFCFSLQKSIRSVLLDGHKLQKRGGGRKRNTDLSDFIVFSSSIPIIRHVGPMS